MSNESNRQDTRTISPSELQACDFFPPGHGWNKDSESGEKTREREGFDDIAIDGARQH